MKKSILSIVAITVLATSSFAEEANSHMITAGMGVTNYSYDGVDFTYGIVDLGYNIGWGSYYINVNAMLPISEDEGYYIDRSMLLQRSQYSLNLAYRLDMGIALFTGINYANNFREDADLSYTDSEIGAHLGVAGVIYTWENVGALTGKAAFSISQLDYSSANNGILTQTGIGYLFGLGLVGSITDDISYNINIDGYSYTYEETSSLSETTAMSTTLKAGVGYMF